MKAEYVAHHGDDLMVVNSARVSMDKASSWEEVDCGHEDCDARCPGVFTRLSEADTKLISYLARHNHWTPFAHPQITLRMGAPVPIRTQCFKHKAGFVENEESRRYIKGTPELYIPDEFRVAAESVKQGSGGKHPISGLWKDAYERIAARSVRTYEDMIADGVCPEQARFILPQGCMVNWIWTGSLAAFARFYRQRTDPHAQREVQQLAERVGQIIEPLYPVSWSALTNG